MANHSTVKDANACFEVIPVTRQVKVPPDQKAIGTVGDHLSEQLTFKFPTHIDGHDVAQCDRKYITWKNVNGELGHDELELLKTEDDEAVYLVWNIRNALTVAKGVVEFSLHLECVEADTGAVRYRWGTATCKNCEILDSINGLLATYAAIYVAGDTLVIADYTPVTDGELALEMPGIVPEGTLEITEAGIHDVAQYSAVDVKAPDAFDTPTIEVDGEAGVVKASANGMEALHQISATDDADLLPENILTGKNILGVTGAATKVELVTATIFRGVSADYTVDTWVHYPTVVNGQITWAQLDITQRTISGTREYQIQCIKGAPITIVTREWFRLTGVINARLVWQTVHYNDIHPSAVGVVIEATNANVAVHFGN